MVPDDFLAYTAEGGCSVEVLREYLSREEHQPPPPPPPPQPRSQDLSFLEERAWDRGYPPPPPPKTNEKEKQQGLQRTYRNEANLRTRHFTRGGSGNTPSYVHSSCPHTRMLALPIRFIEMRVQCYYQLDRCGIAMLY